MKKSIIFIISTAVIFGLLFFLSWLSFRQKDGILSHELSICRQQKDSITQQCSLPRSTLPLRPANIPDRTNGWEVYTDRDFFISFRHPSQFTVVVDPPTGDVVLRRIHIGGVMTLEAVSAGPEGVAGDNPADYERLVYNSIAQNTQPDWTNYNPGYSSEKLGSTALYKFHTNIFDVLASRSLTVPPTSDGLPLQGVLFNPAKSVDWLVYFKPDNEVIADDILRSVSMR